MPRAVRTIVFTTPALVVVAAAWLRLEDPFAPLWRVLALGALALGAAAVPTWRGRAAGALAATVLAGWIAVGAWLVPTNLDPGSGFGLGDSLSTLGTRFGVGFSDFYATHLPFDPRVHAAMGDLVLTGFFTFSLVVALPAAGRKPVGAALAVLLGAGWPATLLGPSHGIAMGAAILAAALVVLAGLGSRRVPALALPAAALVAALAVAVGSATAARHGLVHWQSWNLTNVASGPTSVGFVWDAQYAGLRWPKHPTVVLQVQATQTPAYLRAAVLDDFIGDAWAIGEARPADSLEPRAALKPKNETREIVTVNGLADNRLVGGSVPIRFEAARGAPLIRIEPGFAAIDQNLPRGFRYTVWSYTARPTAAALRRTPPEYPSLLISGDLLDVGRGVALPQFGATDRAGRVQALLLRHPDLNPYVPLARLAEEVAGRARTPYDAVESLENWFVASGGFRYSNRPLVINPPLVGFVTQTRSGYCQYYAGAMALMLRYLGIPARVAVGFAGGQYDPRHHVWVVTDRDAHAWVEVWFKGYGWLPFDPTPAAPGSARRPTLAGTAVAGGGSANGGGVPNAAQGAGTPAIAAKLARQNGFVGPRGRTKFSATAASPADGAGSGAERSRALLFLLLALAVAAGGTLLAKTAVRTTRRLRRGPRGIAAACREELASFLIDQRIGAPRSATLRELGDLVQHEFGVQPAPFVAAATAARFAPLEQASAAARTTRRELRALLDEARRSLTRRERLRGLLSLRSLGSPGS
jgi:transglutaminase-like putative cysteine protease